MERKFFLDKIAKQFQVNRIVALLGPRQCGKSTLAKQYSSSAPDFQKANWFDLENPVDLQRLASPVTSIALLGGLIVVDEIQRRPDLFESLRYIHDEHPDKRFLILGSASRDLIKQSSETLAGRISYLELTPFLATELHASDDKTLWVRGGFPKSFLAVDDDISYMWRHEYIRTYAEQDIQVLAGSGISSEMFKRFWMMLAHYHGQLFNASEIANSLGMSAPTVRSYLDILSATFMVRVLKPWHANLGKREIKTPKIYFRDSGIYHCLMGIAEANALFVSPKIGASWEGFALEQIVQKLGASADDCYFWGTHNQAELDLVVDKRSERIGFEFKYGDAPKLTQSMKIAMEDLQLSQLTVVYPGSVSYQLAERVKVVGLEELVAGIKS